MTDTEQITEPTDLMEYLTSPVESPSDAASDEELQAASDQLDDGQSRPDGDGVATESDPEQPEESSETDDQTADSVDSSPESPPPDAAPNWDSEENPHFQAAQQLEAIRQFAAQQKAEADAKEQRERLINAGKNIAEVDEDDLPVLMGDFIDEVSETAIKPYIQQVESFKHGMTALVAAVRTLPPETQEQVKRIAAEHRELGSTAEEIERVFEVSQRERTASQQREDKLKTQIKNLTAQLAAKTIQDSGADRVEGAVVTGGSGEEPKSMAEYLRDGPL
jgi:hypothetical protein